MSAPRIEIDAGKIRRNASILAARLGRRGIAVTGVTKGAAGHPAIARAMREGGAIRLADARVSNVERMRAAGVPGPCLLIRTPMPSQVGRVVRACEASLNTEIGTVLALGRAAGAIGRVHGVILMIELGDGREGVAPEDAAGLAGEIVGTPGVLLEGIGANFGCLSHRAPSPRAMDRLSSLAGEIGRIAGTPIAVTGGGSASLPWALSTRGPAHMDDLRLGEAILLGRDPLSGLPIDGLCTDAVAIVAEVIESRPRAGGGPRGARSILAIGEQDTDTAALAMPAGMIGAGATSDHMVVATRTPLKVGAEARFVPGYSALMRAASAPDMEMVVSERFRARRRPFRVAAA